VARRFPRAGALAAIVLAAVAAYQAWRGPLPLRRLPVGRDVPEVYRVLARCGDGDPLLELPMGMAVDNFRDAEPQFLSVYHWLPLLNGRGSYAPPLVERVRFLANLALLSPGGRESLRELTGVRWVLVHCREDFSVNIRDLCAGRAWGDVPSRSFQDGEGEVRLFDLGRVAVLPRAVPRRSPPTTGCLTSR
jgi:hypothetical protein